MAVRFLPLICFLVAILAGESKPEIFRPNTGDYIRKGKRIGNIFDEQIINIFPPGLGAAAHMEGAFHTQKIIRRLEIGDDIPVGGEPECPCLSYEELDELTTEEVEKGRQELGNETDVRTYGIGCNYHDLGKAYCSEPCSGSSPSAGCDLAWCKVCAHIAKDCNVN
jgi:hypothetical protein